MPEDRRVAVDGGGPAGDEDITDLLPLPLVRSQLIPPAPNRRASAIDWLPDFGGASWIAYGAASLIVISHFPSPLSPHETLVGPFFQQVIDPPVSAAGDGPAAVNAVAWCPSRPSEGEIAAALGSSIWMYSPVLDNESGSFCWKQTVDISETFTIEAIEWTGSGDGLIAAGIEVVSWIRRSTSWEMAWKLRAKVPQSLVSATWSAEGPVATAAYSLVHSSGISAEVFSFSREEHKCVSVYHRDGSSGITEVQLHHPQSVSMIQWRPTTGTQLEKDASLASRDVLLTCCLDGTVRLWSEIDNGRARKFNKEAHDLKTRRQSYHVIAVIEINQFLRGTLGVDIFIKWAIEFGGVICKGEGDSIYLSSVGSDHDQIGKCEWLISVGPRSSVTYWAIHCLDDISPPRSPRVTLWKKQNIVDLKGCNFSDSDFSNSKDQPILVKVVDSRSLLCGPPEMCSLLQLLPNSSVRWSQLYNPLPNDTEDKSLCKFSKERSLSCFSGGVLNQDGHTGNIIQVALHPYSCEIELAVSLDSDGFLLFWSLSAFSNCTLSMQTVAHPVWKLLGKVTLRDLSTDIGYSCLTWAPSILHDERFLLLGSADGIDCFIVKISEKGDNVLCQKMFTIPFSGCNHGGPPDCIYSTPLASKCGLSFLSNSFLLFCVWTTKFQALSWKVALHSESPSGSNGRCGCDAKGIASSEEGRYVSSFEGQVYHAAIYPGSSDLPAPQNCDQITSVAVVSLDNSILPIQQSAASYGGLCSETVSYHMATGCSDGTLKLWKMSYAESPIHSEPERLLWKLVGMFTAHQGPVSAISLSIHDSKIATVSMNGHNSTARLHIWESICLIGSGGFLLEDAIILKGPVIAINWLSIGNGQLLLGVCLPNEFHVYSQKTSSDQNMVKSEGLKEMHVWYCLALFHSYPVSKNFLWGSKVTPVLVHEKHISVLSQWLFRAETKQSKNASNKENGLKDRTFCSEMSQEQYYSDTKRGLLSMIDIADRLHAYLVVYHPRALIEYLYSGNWRHAQVVLKHLVESIKSNETSTTILGSNNWTFCHNILEILLSKYSEDTISKELCNKRLQWGRDVSSEVSSLQFQGNMSWSMAGDSMANAPKKISTATSWKSEFIYSLENSHDISFIKDMERIQILAVVDLLGEIGDSSHASAYESLDEPGRRFWVSVRFQQLFFLRKYGRLAAAEEFVVDSGLVAWAFQSDCQDDLLNSVLSAEPSWIEMRNLGVGLWYMNASQLRTRMEKLARLQYLKKKDPKDCALLYLALNRLQVLAGLFKISKYEKDKLLVGFLSRNFQEEKNKAAALKNAYVLMGRHQLELAIAFFLLGGDPSSAVTVCAKNLGDEQLALVICRLIEGYGGSLERQLISNILLPNAIEKGDYWLSSLFEWTLGNYSDSVKVLFDLHNESLIDKSVTLCDRPAFSDPNIGQYCVVLAAKNSFRNSAGDVLAMILSKFGRLLAAKALDRCGLPLEALECLSSSLIIEGKDRGSLIDIASHKIFHGILNPFSSGACNWLLGDVALELESNVKLNMALQYISKVLRDHPRWPLSNLVSSREMIIYKKHDTYQDETQTGELKHYLNRLLFTFEQKFSSNSVDLANMILIFACNKELLFLGYLMLQVNISQEDENDHHGPRSPFLNPALPRLLLKASREISYFVARYVVFCCFSDSVLKLVYNRDFTSEKDMYGLVHTRDCVLQSIIYQLRIFRLILKQYDREYSTEGVALNSRSVLDLVEYCIFFSSTWFRRHLKGLILMIHPILNAFVNGQSSLGGMAGELMKALHQTSELMFHDASGDSMGFIPDAICQQKQLEQSNSLMPSISEDEKWHLVGACLWMHLSNFMKNHFSKFPVTERPKDENSIMDLISLFPLTVAKLLAASLSYVSSSLVKQLASFLRWKALKGLPVTTIVWLDECSQSQPGFLHHYLNQEVATSQLPIEDSKSFFNMLREISLNPQDICAEFIKERVPCFPCTSRKLFSSWKDMHADIFAEYENAASTNNRLEDSCTGSIPNDGAKSIRSGRVLDTDGFVETRWKCSSSPRDATYFCNPKEVAKRSGELIEAICFNSINEQQVALASNRKGLLFFNWKAEKPLKEQADYIWSESDWPQDGWAGCESTPIPTYVSPGVGLGSKRGAHLGLGGATVGIGSLARPGRDLTGGGAFGIPGYAGIGASGLGWGEQEDFDESMDPPATIENVRTRALSCHPSRPFFLVGSTNTHVYLWEFGKDRALATYGVLPAANVPPPYALASISALQFDHCGHRFATAALDGTVCTWQLEVGGRSNVHPTDSSLCFSNHASDVAYVAASGSIIAAAGCNSNGVNVVVWDTLAPPATCQASIICHEGGARSLSVFDNDVGSGSISPLIVTGGKGGDVGLHDFRFIATGKTKRHRHSNEHDYQPSTLHEMNSGTSKYGENTNGMVWYIPKAHLGSVTRISTIPNTSLFLTGSKDGDVKLWDAKRSQLIFHWQKLHERHTFLKSNSRGFVRAAVTDIQVFSHGFLTCGGDGSVKLVQLK
ncbi:uncharacterized protein LOC103713736 isoform X2 [Phoenix dactylifera]|uniref:Uncharacterized protein LOC103713736 isoform X2 n=1 Tax=Phoenix dactylifera TaxID=42345 RepID=A0A8B7MW04_PHODC|nr:uncharacterized protein LOC103713736 isoform X2 [Phoenix dactylifera]